MNLLYHIWNYAFPVGMCQDFFSHRKKAVLIIACVNEGVGQSRQETQRLEITHVKSRRSLEDKASFINGF